MRRAAIGCLISVNAVLSKLVSVQNSSPELEQNAKLASQAVDTVAEFADTIQNNPGRRLISIYLGMLVGLLIAWIADLDLFQASLGMTISFPNWPNIHLGVCGTGLIMGLGANPAHEIIQMLDEIKKRQGRAGNP